MDILNFISWIRGRRQVTSVEPAKTLLPVALKDGRRDDEYLTGAISVEDFAAQVAPQPSYKVYTALLTQSGTNDPVATVLENNLGVDVTWVRNGSGSYSLDFSTVIPSNKVFIPAWSSYEGSNGIILPLSNQSAINGYMQIYLGVVDGTNCDRIWLDTLDNTFSASEWSSVLSNTKIYFEIRVYN